jgi:transcriptional regulator with XRE-family HTH domain
LTVSRRLSDVFGSHAAAVLRRCRERAGISQERLAEQARMTRTYVGRVERRVLNPTLASTHRLLTVLNVSWTEFGAAVDAELAADSRRTRRRA